MLDGAVIFQKADELSGYSVTVVYRTESEEGEEGFWATLWDRAKQRITTRYFRAEAEAVGWATVIC